MGRRRKSAEQDGALPARDWQKRRGAKRVIDVKDYKEVLEASEITCVRDVHGVKERTI